MLKRLSLLAVAAAAFAAPLHAQGVIYDNGLGPVSSGPTALHGIVLPGVSFIVGNEEVALTQFGFYGASSTGGLFKMFVANAAGTVLTSNTLTLAASTTPTLFLSDVFSLALHAGQTYRFGIIGTDIDERYTATSLAPSAVIETQNGLTPIAGNDLWNTFATPTLQQNHGGANLSVELIGTVTVNSVTSTPEPGTWALMATGLAGLVPVVIRRRRSLHASRTA